MTTIPDAVRSAQARARAYRTHALHDPRETTRRAREAFEARFTNQVPDAIWLEDPTEAARRAECFRKSYFAGLTAKSLEARSKRKNHRRASALSLTG